MRAPGHRREPRVLPRHPRGPRGLPGAAADRRAPDADLDALHRLVHRASRPLRHRPRRPAPGDRSWSGRRPHARARLSALIFPEGTRSRDGRLGALKPGAFHLPVEFGVAFQPVGDPRHAARSCRRAPGGPARGGVGRGPRRRGHPDRGPRGRAGAARPRRRAARRLPAPSGVPDGRAGASARVRRAFNGSGPAPRRSTRSRSRTGAASREEAPAVLDVARRRAQPGGARPNQAFSRPMNSSRVGFAAMLASPARGPRRSPFVTNARRTVAARPRAARSAPRPAGRRLAPDSWNGNTSAR